MLIAAGIAAGLIGVGYGIHRLLLWAEDRGYVYYLNEKRPPGPSLGFLAQIYEPEMEYVVEEETSQLVRAEEDESGRGGDGDPEA